MRLPEGLHGPTRLPSTWWIAGAGVMVILIFVAMAMPWYGEIGRLVHDGDLPQPRFHPRGWGGLSCLGAGGYAEISVDSHGHPGVSDARLQEWMRERTLNVYVRAHRSAPWSSVARLLESAARAGRGGIGLQIGPWHYLDIALVTEPPAPPCDEEVTIGALPLPDPEGTLAANRAHRASPVVRLAGDGDPDVESVVHALECYADDDARVHLAIRR